MLISTLLFARVRKKYYLCRVNLHSATIIIGKNLKPTLSIEKAIKNKTSKNK